MKQIINVEGPPLLKHSAFLVALIIIMPNMCPFMVSVWMHKQFSFDKGVVTHVKIVDSAYQFHAIVFFFLRNETNLKTTRSQHLLSLHDWSRFYRNDFFTLFSSTISQAPCVISYLSISMHAMTITLEW